MYKQLVTIAAFALLAAAGAQAQIVNCNLTTYNGTCVLQGVLDADGFSVTLGPLNFNNHISIETMPSFAGQANDTKIMTSNGVTLLADDELNHGFDRYVCGPGAPACTNAYKIMPYSTATNQVVRVLIKNLSN
jgi:hypothetical protein